MEPVTEMQNDDKRCDVIRAVVAAVLALGIMGAALFSIVTGRPESQALIGWAGIVVGVYVGYFAGNSRRSG